MNDMEYHAHPAMSQSKMKVLLECPRQFYIEYVLGKKIDTPTPSKALGNCLDLALTEPDKYNQLIVKHTKTTSVEGYITEHWKSQIDEWISNLHRYTFDDDFFGGATFRDIIDTCTTQDKIFYKYKEIDWRLKTDFLNIENGFFIDLKSTRAKTYDEYIKDFIKYKYYLQASSYTVGIKEKYNLDYLPKAYYIAVSTVTGEVFAYMCGDRMIQLGIMELDHGCELYKQNLISNAWAKNRKLETLELPVWLEQKIINLGVNI
jgi:hypothetical protein